MAEQINLFDPNVRADPFPSYAQLRLGAPVQKVQPGDIWAVSRAADVEYVLKSSKIFAAGFEPIFRPDWLPYNPMGDSMLVKDGQDHAQLRGLLNRAFTPSAMARLEHRIRAYCVEIADHLAAVREGDFVEELCMRLPGLVVTELLGFDRKLMTEIKRWVGHLVSVSPIYPGDEAADAIRASIRELEGFIRENIAVRRANPGEDTMSTLVTAELNGRHLTDEEIVAFMFLLVPSAFETTVHFFSNMLLDFDRRPEVFTQLREDRTQIPAYIEELLRMEPPVHSIFRITAVDTELGGVSLPRGSLVMVLLGSANRDPAQFADPDRFAAARDSHAGFAFGHGIHNCLGAPLVRLEGRLLLEELATRFTRFEKLPGELEWNLMFHVRGPVKLPFRVHLAA